MHLPGSSILKTCRTSHDDIRCARGSRDEYHSCALFIIYSAYYLFFFFFLSYFYFDEIFFRARPTKLLSRTQLGSRAPEAENRLCVHSFTACALNTFGRRPSSPIKNKLDPLALSRREVAHIFHFFPPPARRNNASENNM